VTEESARVIDPVFIDSVVQRYGETGTLIAILSDIQKEYSYLPRAALQRISQTLGIPESQVFSVSSFFKVFSLAPRGKHAIRVCRGTACHVKGAGLLLDKLKRDLGIEEGETTTDGRFTLETVRCVGCCSIAPVVMVDETAHGRLTQAALPKIVREIPGGAGAQKKPARSASERGAGSAPTALKGKSPAERKGRARGTHAGNTPGARGGRS
jgi:NADH-quinone oxidoreductase subunit E